MKCGLILPEHVFKLGLIYLPTDRCSMFRLGLWLNILEQVCTGFYVSAIAIVATMEDRMKVAWCQQRNMHGRWYEYSMLDYRQSGSRIFIRNHHFMSIGPLFFDWWW